MVWFSFAITKTLPLAGRLRDAGSTCNSIGQFHARPRLLNLTLRGCPHLVPGNQCLGTGTKWCGVDPTNVMKCRDREMRSLEQGWSCTGDPFNTWPQMRWETLFFSDTGFFVEWLGVICHIRVLRFWCLVHHILVHETNYFVSFSGISTMVH